ncbi:TPA: hypothetical protein OOF45_000159 [Morganella morganii]|uniref:hypothetical protein n=1 Tax=Morganella morganii TaxID=582 RepID=UPI0023DE1966|nr:hypothetical protein [Morganella morganii]MDF2407553.1 hypothetical protein [Morganella morganii]HCR4030192.1 hypothetical protein [Morganella morganii]HDS6844947.1 hypothetical protein [Morganella morganii subsp. morganii]
MSTATKIWLGVCGTLAVSLLLILHLYGGLKDNYQTLKDNHSALTAVNNITLSAVAINQRVALDNIKAKETEGTENVKVKTAIRTEFKDSECAVTPVSPGVVGKLQQYERDIRARAGGAYPATADR